MNNNILKILQVSNAFIQAPMLGITSPAMVSAISNTGGLGSLPVGGLSAEHTRNLIRETKKLTNCVINVNTFAYELPEISDSLNTSATNMALTLNDISVSAGLSNVNVHSDNKPPPCCSLEGMASYKDQIPVFIEENISVVSFTFGCMTKEEIKKLQNARIAVVGTATNVAEALYLKEHGVDVIIAQGYEAGGHRGSFLPVPSQRPLGAANSSRETCDPPGIGLFSLLPQVCAAVNSSGLSCSPRGAPSRTKYTPIVAAGGIYSGRTAVAAYTLGADAVQLGSCFINTKESLATQAHKRAVATAADTCTDYTAAFSGRSARGLRNTFSGLMYKYPPAETPCANIAPGSVEESTLLPYPVQNILTTPGNSEFSNIWAGQSSGRYGSCSIGIGFDSGVVPAVALVNDEIPDDDVETLLETFGNRSCKDVLYDIVSDTNSILSKQMGLY